MTGRKRKAGARDRSGRLRRVSERALEEAVMAVVLNQPHRSWLPEEQRRDQLAECHLGRLRLLDAITVEQYQAGVSFRRTVARMRRVLNCPPEAPVGLSLIGRGTGSGEDIPPETADDYRADYNDAVHAVMVAFPPLEANRVTRELRSVVVSDRQVSDLVALNRGLTILAKHYRLTNQRKSAHGRNAS